MGKIIFTINETLNDLNITKNKLAVEAKLRPNLITELANEETKAIKIETLTRILDTLNDISKQQGLDRKFDLKDILLYKN